MKFTYENPMRRVDDFKLINNFISTSTTIDKVSSLEIGAGEGWFTIIAKSHGWDTLAIDFNPDLESVKYGYVEVADVCSYTLPKKVNVIHSNVFMYMGYTDVINFFKRNIDLFDIMFITYNTNRKDNRFDENRVSFFDESFFVKLSQLFDLEYIILEESMKRILCKKGVGYGA